MVFSGLSVRSLRLPLYAHLPDDAHRVPICSKILDLFRIVGPSVLTTRVFSMAENSEYVLELLREGVDFTLHRGRERGNQMPILAAVLSQAHQRGLIRGPGPQASSALLPGRGILDETQR